MSSGVVIGRDRELAEGNGFLAEAAQRREGCCSSASRESARRRSGRRSSTRRPAAASACSSRGRPRPRRSSRSPSSPISSRASTSGRSPSFLSRSEPRWSRRCGDARPARPSIRRLSRSRCSASCGCSPLRSDAGRRRRPPVGRRAQPSRAHVCVSSARRAPRRARRDGPRGLRSRPDAARSRDGSSLERIEIGGLGKRHLARARLRANRADARRRHSSGASRELSGGSPYYALELAATGDPELALPETLAAALRARLATLSDAARAAGSTAATLGASTRRHRRVHGAGSTSCVRPAIVDERSGEPAVRAPAPRIDVARHAHARGAACRPRRARGRARGSRRAGAPPRPGDGHEPSEAVAAELESAPPTARRARRTGDRGALAERAAALTPESDHGATTPAPSPGRGSLPGGG